MNKFVKFPAAVSPLTGVAMAILITGLTACGDTKTSEPTAAAANASDGAVDQSAPAANIATPDSDLIVPDSTDAFSDSSTPAAPVPDAIPTDTVSVPTDPTQPAVPDQTIVVVPVAASDVNCEADAAIFSQSMLEVINASRVQARACGDSMHTAVPTVRWNNQLTQAAIAHASDMTTNNFFSHDGSDGLGVSNRVETAQYDWRAVGENIAAGQLDVAEAHQGWLDSAGHCRNIMNSLFTEVGAACQADPNTDFGTYWVVVFGDTK